MKAETFYRNVMSMNEILRTQNFRFCLQNWRINFCWRKVRNLVEWNLQKRKKEKMSKQNFPPHLERSQKDEFQRNFSRMMMMLLRGWRFADFQENFNEEFSVRFAWFQTMTKLLLRVFIFRRKDFAFKLNQHESWHSRNLNENLFSFILFQSFFFLLEKSEICSNFVKF